MVMVCSAPGEKVVSHMWKSDVVTLSPSSNLSCVAFGRCKLRFKLSNDLCYQKIQEGWAGTQNKCKRSEFRGGDLGSGIPAARAAIQVCWVCLPERKSSLLNTYWSESTLSSR